MCLLKKVCTFLRSYMFKTMRQWLARSIKVARIRFHFRSLDQLGPKGLRTIQTRRERKLVRGQDQTNRVMGLFRLRIIVLLLIIKNIIALWMRGMRIDHSGELMSTKAKIIHQGAVVAKSSRSRHKIKVQISTKCSEASWAQKNPVEQVPHHQMASSSHRTSHTTQVDSNNKRFQVIQSIAQMTLLTLVMN